jgi:hypothetical protein
VVDITYCVGQSRHGEEDDEGFELHFGGLVGLGVVEVGFVGFWRWLDMCLVERGRWWLGTLYRDRSGGVRAGVLG